MAHNPTLVTQIQHPLDFERLAAIDGSAFVPQHSH